MEIQRVDGRADWNRFFRLPWKIYQDDPAWRPPLLMDLRQQFNPRKNPFFSFGCAQAWLLLQEGRAIGRIVAFTDAHYEQSGDVRTGFLGFFECIDDAEAARALFAAAAEWLQARGKTRMRGPINFSTANECGVLMSGFEHPPLILMNHSRPYYARLFAQCGFYKAHDLLAFDMSTDKTHGSLARFARVGERSLRQSGLNIRQVNLKKYQMEIETLTRLYNSFMADNWGFVPASDEEMAFAAKSMRLILDPRLVFFIEKDGKPLGCSLSLPDINEVLKRLNGRLFPTGIFTFLLHRRKIRRFRYILLGVASEYRNRGLDVLMMHRTMVAAREGGYQGAELSWISEDNKNLISILHKIGAECYKTYRVYEAAITPPAPSVSTGESGSARPQPY